MQIRLQRIKGKGEIMKENFKTWSSLLEWSSRSMRLLYIASFCLGESFKSSPRASWKVWGPGCPSLSIDQVSWGYLRHLLDPSMIQDCWLLPLATIHLLISLYDIYESFNGFLFVPQELMTKANLDKMTNESRWKNRDSVSTVNIIPAEHVPTAQLWEPIQSLCHHQPNSLPLEPLGQFYQREKRYIFFSLPISKEISAA